ncbi:haloacid dehalogenase [Bifidobacterium hapali]|uniref:phosphomannomutase n=1 Tax=Bifidobacterium hapali TaxID=1630172 RepID=A0A261FXB9_9BIFI|nr:HAD-IIB family hydrolase [Bifidobacterium hapali]OZG63844.1 haloacid dehalogenase [Bifidobacterium hapali]
MTVVHSWNDIDYIALAARMRVIAFDLDNTLASSKQPMIPAMIDRFAALTHCLPVAVVTGGRYELVVSQILEVVHDRANLTQLHLMPTGGTRYYRWNKPEHETTGSWTCVYTHDLSEVDRRSARTSLERRARELGLWETTVWGARFEDRGSQLTFSALGQNAPESAKRAWDPGDIKKQRLVNAVAGDLPHLKVRSGGYTSIDVSLPGMDKSFAVHELSKILNTPVDSIVFVGDRMTPGGNDYPAAIAGAWAISVSSPADTLLMLDQLLPALHALQDELSTKPTNG